MSKYYYSVMKLYTLKTKNSLSKADSLCGNSGSILHSLIVRPSAFHFAVDDLNVQGTQKICETEVCFENLERTSEPP